MGEDQGGYDGLDCVECVFIPPNTAHRGHDWSNEIWAEFAQALTEGQIKLNAQTLYLIEPDTGLTESLSAIEHYKSMVTQNQIRARHGRPALQIGKPWIADYADQQQADLPMVMAVRPHCHAIIVETFDGWIVFDGKKNAMEDVLQPLADLFGAEVIAAAHRDLPQH